MYGNLIMLGIFLLVACPVRAMGEEQKHPLVGLFDDSEEKPKPLSVQKKVLSDSTTAPLLAFLDKLGDYCDALKIYRYHHYDNGLNSMETWNRLTNSEKKTVEMGINQKKYVYLEVPKEKIWVLVIGTGDECRVKKLFILKEKSQLAQKSERPELKRSKSFWRRRKQKPEEEVKVKNPLFGMGSASPGWEAHLIDEIIRKKK